MLKLYLVTRKESGGCDTYDNFVVCCGDEIEAAETDPSKSLYEDWANAWCKPSEVIVRYLGVADPSVLKGIICSSYNNG